MNSPRKREKEKERGKLIYMNRVNKLPGVENSFGIKKKNLKHFIFLILKVYRIILSTKGEKKFFLLQTE